MKIIFLCGALEPGRNGIGDYVRYLAIELIKQGHKVAAIALNDRHLREQVTGYQNSDGVALTVLRLPSKWPAKKRFNAAQHWIDIFNPEWISLQYVPFSFQLKGLPFGLSKWLKNFGINRRWHIMFHELWVGQNIEATTKHILWGILQQLLIKSMVSDLKPSVIHTQSSLHLALLAKHNIPSRLLPLFANIPTTYYENSNSSGIRNVSQENSKLITLVIFGMIHPRAPVDELAKEVAKYEKARGVKVVLKLVGHCGREQGRWISAWNSAGLAAEVLGEQSPNRISEVLGTSTVGITTTPVYRIEKSGTVAAMRNHDLPIMCVSEPWTPRGITNVKIPSDVSLYSVGYFDSCLSCTLCSTTKTSVLDVSRQFASDLSEVYKDPF